MVIPFRKARAGADAKYIPRERHFEDVASVRFHSTVLARVPLDASGVSAVAAIKAVANLRAFIFALSVVMRCGTVEPRLLSSTDRYFNHANLSIEGSVVLGGMHHEYSLASASAGSNICGLQLITDADYESLKARIVSSL